MKRQTVVTPPRGTGRTMPRREFLKALAAMATAGAAGAPLLQASGAAAAAERFPDGIKSGDPAPQGAVIWTRVAGDTSGPTPVLWSVAEDAAMQNVVRGGLTEVDSSTPPARPRLPRTASPTGRGTA